LENGVVTSTVSGTPQGSPISQLALPDGTVCVELIQQLQQRVLGAGGLGSGSEIRAARVSACERCASCAS
jgi:hypothetical protein